MIGSILEQDGQFYAFLESSTINRSLLCCIRKSRFLPSLTVDFETMTAHWAESGSCVYSKAGTRQTHLAAVERAGGNFAQADFHYNYPMIGSILEQDGQFYAFLESSTINPAGLSLMGYYWYLELEENGLFKKKLAGYV